ncbi:hypothetical protein VNO77_00466 [Canavalia gladiata]|uniref:Uncharacterized protein n=1 Tax=Canavalia gladiata TaxID=3824 RepID=A0AAN9R5B9_CANGL
MASVQCQKTCEESSQQKRQHGSFGEKISEFFKGHQHHDHPNDGTKTHTQYYSQTEVVSQSGHLTSKTQTQCSCSNTDTKGQGRNTKQNKKSLFQKIKDGLSGHSSESESESDSDSDNENRHKRKD